MTRAATAIINVYRLLGSIRHQVLWSVFGYSSVCKHNPSCSQYAIMQIQERGTILGSWKAFLRIIRCW